MRAFLAVGCTAILLLTASHVPAADTDFKAGVAVKVITPGEPMWMGGYGARNKPAEGKATELYAKAVALEDPAGGKLVLLTTDLLGLPRELSAAVAREVQKRTGLPRERFLMSSSHTHCGPVLAGLLMDMYDMPEAERQKIGPYTEKLRGLLVETAVAALSDLKPARLAFGKGTARFAVNRREPTPKGIINGRNPEGPADHDVPVLRVTAPDGALRAVVFGYACHNTTLQFYQWCGDYAGFAQANIEEKHPGATALFWMGCGADANPLPRSTVELCRKYGRELADAVEDVLRGDLKPISGPCAARYAEVSLPLDTLPDKDRLAADMLSKNFALRRRAERLTKLLETNGKLDDHYPYYPVQVWRLGQQVTWIALGGEVVVDYSIRLHKALGDRPTWIMGYANDVMAYIPSVRVLKEGGYEGDSSMIFYGFPTKWAPPIEEKIVGKALELVKDVSAKTP